MFAVCFAWGTFIVFHNCVALPLFSTGFCFRIGNWPPLHRGPIGIWRMICNANVLLQHLRGRMRLVLVIQVVFLWQSIFMEGAVLFALHRVVVAHIDGGEELPTNVTCVALCQKQ